MFESGAILGDVLYCVSLSPNCCEMLGFSLLTSHASSGSFQASLSLMLPTETTPSEARHHDGGVLRLLSLAPSCKQAKNVHHLAATFVHGSFIYVFEGMCELQRGSKTWGMYLNTMWRFDVKARTWLRVSFFGCKPCPRAHMGVAFDERRATIVGGVTAKPDGRKVYLADVWEFEFESCCCIQVVPDNPLGGWISARSGAACSLMNGNTLVVLACVGPHGLVNRDEMVILTVARGSAAQLASKAGRSGPLHDRGLLRACAKVVGIWREIAELPGWVRSLYTAPFGSVIFLVSEPLHLLIGAFTPSHKSREECKLFLPSDCIFSPEAIHPIRPLGGNAHNVWGSTECPFDISPRWLNCPCEISVNLASASSAVQRLEEPVSLRQIVKQFGTIKAAVEYFKLCQPQVHLSGWKPIEASVKDTKTLRWHWQECEAFAVNDVQGCRQQIYITAVLGPVFFSLLATRCPQPNSLSATDFCMLILFNIQTQIHVPIPPQRCAEVVTWCATATRSANVQTGGNFWTQSSLQEICQPGARAQAMKLRETQRICTMGMETHCGLETCVAHRPYELNACLSGAKHSFESYLAKDGACSGCCDCRKPTQPRLQQPSLGLPTESR
ncbi:g5721 [Coccomyxa elongata]